MARGRMINTTVALDPEFNAMSLEAQLLFLRAIPHLDRDGLLVGIPAVLWATIAPLMPDLLPLMDGIVEEWKQAGLITVFETKIGPVFYFDSFHRNQVGLRYDREPESRIPLPDGFERTADGIRQAANSTPEAVRQSSGNVPAQEKGKGSRKGKEVEGNGKTRVRAHEPTQPNPPAPSPTPALQIFQEFHTRDSPSSAQATAIVQTVSDLDRWRAVLTEWSLRGFNTGNVRGLLDWYREGIPPASKNGADHGKHGRRTAPEPAPAAAADDEPFDEERVRKQLRIARGYAPAETPADTAAGL